MIAQLVERWTVVPLVVCSIHTRRTKKRFHYLIWLCSVVVSYLLWVQVTRIRFPAEPLVSWSSWLGRLLYTQKIAGSNPAETISFLSAVVFFTDI